MSRSHGTCRCRSRARFRPATPRRRSPSRPGSAAFRRRPRRRSTHSPRSSLTRACTPVCITRPTCAGRRGVGHHTGSAHDVRGRPPSGNALVSRHRGAHPLGVATISARLSGTPITPAMLFVVVGSAGRAQGARRGRHRELEFHRAHAGGGDAGARALVRRLAHRFRAAPARVRRAGAAPGHWPPADDRARRCCGGGGLRPVDLGRGRDPRDRVGPDRRRAWPGGRHRAPGPATDSPGPEHRERTQRRDLRAAALRRRRRGRRGIRDSDGRNRLPPSSWKDTATAWPAA